jgi:two-component system sensor histidine kinase KdpD
MALRQTAHEVGVRQAGDNERAMAGFPEARAPARSQEKILVLVTADPSSAALIRRAKRVADFISAECVAVAVAPNHARDPQFREAIEKHLNFARNLHVETRLLDGESVPETLVQFARTHGITQIFMNWPRRTGWHPPFIRNDIQKIVNLAKEMQMTIVDDHRRAHAAGM